MRKIERERKGKTERKKRERKTEREGQIKCSFRKKVSQGEKEIELGENTRKSRE